MHSRARPEEGDAWFDAAIGDAERQRNVPTLALAYNLRGITLRRRGRLDEAERCHRAALALYVERGAPAGLSLSLASLGYIFELRGDVTGARQHHLAGLDAACDANDVRAQALALEGLAGVASRLGDDAGIGRYLGAAAALREATGGPLAQAERADVERALDLVGDRAIMSAGFTTGRAGPDVCDRERPVHRIASSASGRVKRPAWSAVPTIAPSRFAPAAAASARTTRSSIEEIPPEVITGAGWRGSTAR